MAKSLNELAPKYGIDFVYLVGDNIYYDGITSVDDDRWDDTYLEIFDTQTYPNLQNLPFYVQTGNHDYHGNVQAQIDYSQKDPTGRWTMPDLWYTIPNLEKYSVAMITIDTDILVGSNGTDTTEIDTVFKIEEQYDWIEKQLIQNQDKDFLIVTGHHPIFSIASHGPDYQLIARLLPLLQKYQVSCYIAGHDHTMQLILDYYGEDLDQSIYHITSGQGGKIKDDRSHEETIEEMQNVESVYQSWSRDGILVVSHVGYTRDM